MSHHREQMLSYCLEEQEWTLLKLTDTLHSLEEVHFKMAELIRLHVNAGYFLTTTRGGLPHLRNLTLWSYVHSMTCSFQLSTHFYPDVSLILSQATITDIILKAYNQSYRRIPKPRPSRSPRPEKNGSLKVTFIT